MRGSRGQRVFLEDPGGLYCRLGPGVSRAWWWGCWDCHFEWERLWQCFQGSTGSLGAGGRHGRAWRQVAGVPGTPWPTHPHYSAIMPSAQPSAPNATPTEDAYVETDNEYVDQDVKSKHDDGTTAVTAVLVGQRLVMAHVGDSRAVLCEGGLGERRAGGASVACWRGGRGPWGGRAFEGRRGVAQGLMLDEYTCSGMLLWTSTLGGFLLQLLGAGGCALVQQAWGWAAPCR